MTTGTAKKHELKSGDALHSTDPLTGQIFATHPLMSEDEVHTCIESAHSAFEDWRGWSFAERGHSMRALGALLEGRQDELATLMTREMGKPRREALAEIRKCAKTCTYYAELAADFLADEEIKTEKSKSLITYQPIGVILAVMPWNFPLWQVIRFAAPTLMAGNAAVLKHASNVTGCALALEEMFRDADFPPGLFGVLRIQSESVADVIAHPHIRAVTLTGSTAAGRAVAAEAGKHLKKTVLELGGSDAYIILEDADIALAAKTCTTSRLLNCGQSCIAAKRFIVVDTVYDEFLRAFTHEMNAHSFGDPHDNSATLGPMVSPKARDALHKQVEESIQKGARCVLGGHIPEPEGAFYPPTILENVTPGMPAYDDELFGPVAAVIRAKDEADAIRIANDSPYGLGGGVFTINEERGLEIARLHLDTGSVAINGFVSSDARLPFGGVKDSGYGRELSTFGIREFVNIKTVTVG